MNREELTSHGGDNRNFIVKRIGKFKRALYQPSYQTLIMQIQITIRQMTYPLPHHTSNPHPHQCQPPPHCHSHSPRSCLNPDSYVVLIIKH